MRKSTISTPPNYFDRYIQLVDDIDLPAAFQQSLLEFEALDLHILNNIGDKTYAPEKWTIRQIIQHLTDWERIMGYRALITARKASENPLPSHDENLMSDNLILENRPLQAVLSELKTVRHATIALFEGFDNAILSNTGQSGDYQMSVLGWGFTILGHQRHHFNVIRERYLPLVWPA
jgi:DinB superfamily